MANQGYEWSGTADGGGLPNSDVTCRARTIIQHDDAHKQLNVHIFSAYDKTKLKLFSKELEVSDDKYCTGDKTTRHRFTYTHGDSR
jgi:hypothetical protein